MPARKPKKAPTRRVRRTEVKRRLLEAAERLFIDQGLDATSLESVARAAGFSKGAIYSNFESKEELCFAILSAGLDRRIEAVAPAADSPGGPARRMSQAGDLLLRIVESEPGWQVFFVELWLRCMRNPRLARRFAEKRRLMRSQVAAVIETQSRAAGIRLRIPSEQLASSILALSNGLGIEGLIDRSSVPHDLMGKVMSWTLKGMETEEQPQR